jgi:DNA-binding MarR family transcriptional regulator
MFALQKTRSDRAPERFQDGLGMLTRRVYFHMVRSAGRLLAPWDVTVEQYVVLLCLGDEQRLTQQELVRRCSSDPRTMGKMLDRLADKDWIKRVDHATDRRAWQIVLSAKGRRAKRQMDEALQPLRERPAQVLGAAETNALQATLAKLADALEPSAWLFLSEESRSAKVTRPSRKGNSRR